MATYNRTYAGESPQNLTMSFSLVERPIYGSSRIANFVDSVQLVYLEAGETEFSYPDDIELLEQNNGTKHFELTNHLGNVMAVVSDKRTPVLNATATAIETFQPELLIAKDYYPFGMEMSGRYDENDPEDLSVGYRYGFNGMEKDDEVTGQTGSVYTAMFWEYDARIGRRWNLDPKPQISISDYACFADNPIYYIDKNGDKWEKKSDQRKANNMSRQADRLINKYERRIERLGNNNEKREDYEYQINELTDAKSELIEMEQSDIIFSFKRYTSIGGGNTSDYNVSVPYLGEIKYVTMEYADKRSKFHEAKHGHQFVTGELGNESDYDVSDEVAAKRREYAACTNLQKNISILYEEGYIKITNEKWVYSVMQNIRYVPESYLSITRKYLLESTLKRY